MASRWLRLTILLGWVFWTAAFVPGHTRGVVRLYEGDCCSKGSAKAAETAPLCKNCPPATDHSKKDSDKPAAPGCCAVCFFAGFLHTPPPPVFFDHRAGLVEIRSVIDSSDVLRVELLLTCNGRAPPRLS